MARSYSRCGGNPEGSSDLVVKMSAKSEYRVGTPRESKESEDFVYSFVRSTAPIERVGDEPSGLKSNLAIEMSSLLLEQNSEMLLH